MAEETSEEREERAKNSTSAEELEKLAEDEDYYVRSAVAENTNTPASLLDKLADDEEEYVRSAVTRNKNTPAAVLEKEGRKKCWGKSLAEDKSVDVRSNVAENPNTPIPLLEILAEDHEKDVREKVAENINTNGSLLEKLAEDKDEGVRQSVADNSNTPVSVLEKLTEDKAKDSDDKKEGDSSIINELTGFIYANKARDAISFEWLLKEDINDFSVIPGIRIDLGEDYLFLEKENHLYDYEFEDAEFVEGDSEKEYCLCFSELFLKFGVNDDVLNLLKDNNYQIEIYIHKVKNHKTKNVIEGYECIEELEGQVYELELN